MSVQPQPPLGRVAILGLGLIGGSIGAAIKQRGLASRVIGYSPHHGSDALAHGLIDELALSNEHACKDADLVVIAVPPSAIAPTLIQIGSALLPTAVVTDTGSTKSKLMAQAQVALGSAYARFIPGHPIAGSEQSGPFAANAQLFNLARVILTPDPKFADPKCVQTVQNFWTSIGASTQILDAQVHDRQYALVSHLPHWVSYALAATLAHQTDASQLAQAGGAGLRDTTRIAGSSGALWVDISEQNREPLLAAITQFQGELAALKLALQVGDSQTLVALFNDASMWRKTIL
jgi:prephenate dehydrogenase